MEVLVLLREIDGGFKIVIMRPTLISGFNGPPPNLLLLGNGMLRGLVLMEHGNGKVVMMVQRGQMLAHLLPYLLSTERQKTPQHWAVMAQVTNITNY